MQLTGANVCGRATHWRSVVISTRARGPGRPYYATSIISNFLQHIFVLQLSRTRKQKSRTDVRSSYKKLTLKRIKRAHPIKITATASAPFQRGWRQIVVRCCPRVNNKVGAIKSSYQKNKRLQPRKLRRVMRNNNYTNIEIVVFKQLYNIVICRS